MKRHRLAESDQIYFELVSERLSRSFDHWHWNDLLHTDTRHRLVSWSRSPVWVWTEPHLEDQFTTRHQVIVQQKRFPISLTVERRGLNVDVTTRNSTRFNHKRSAVLELESHFGKQRRADRIDLRTRRYRIKSRCTQHVPRRHLSAVFITDQTIRTCLVKLVHDLTH